MLGTDAAGIEAMAREMASTAAIASSAVFTNGGVGASCSGTEGGAPSGEVGARGSGIRMGAEPSVPPPPGEHREGGSGTFGGEGVAGAALSVGEGDFMSTLAASMSSLAAGGPPPPPPFAAGAAEAGGGAGAAAAATASAAAAPAGPRPWLSSPGPAQYCGGQGTPEGAQESASSGPAGGALVWEVPTELPPLSAPPRPPPPSSKPLSSQAWASQRRGTLATYELNPGWLQVAAEAAGGTDLGAFCQPGQPQTQPQSQPQLQPQPLRRRQGAPQGGGVASLVAQLQQERGAAKAAEAAAGGGPSGAWAVPLDDAEAALRARFAQVW